MTVNEIIGRALSETGTFAPRDVMAAAVVKALGEAGYRIIDENELSDIISDAARDADERRD